MIANTYVVKPFGISEVKVIALKGEPGGPTQEQVNTAVEEYMDDHPEAQIPDGAVTTEKLASNAVTPYADNLVSSSYVSDSEPYLFRKTFAGVREDTEIVGGSVVWNQLVYQARQNGTANGLTFTRDGATLTITDTCTTSANFTITGGTINYIDGHVYLAFAGAVRTANYYLVFGGASPSVGEDGAIMKKTSSSLSVTMHIESGTTMNLTIKPMLFDLTLMFGTEIADYIYAQEQAAAGAGVAFFRSLFDKPYYAYNAGEIISVNTSAHKMVGFNQWDEEWELGGLNSNTGGNTVTTNYIRSKNYISVLPQTAYYFKTQFSIPSASIYVYYYDANKGFLEGGRKWSTNQTTPANARYMRFFFAVSSYGSSTYNNDICINISDPQRNGTYEPYTAHEYPLDSSLTLRGLPKLDGDSIYYDGDAYKGNKAGTITYKAADMGTLPWTANGTSGGYYEYAVTVGDKAVGQYNVFCDVFPTAVGAGLPNTIRGRSSTTTISVLVAESSLEAFVSSVSGHKLYYELPSPMTQESGGVVTVRYAVTDLGSINWSYNDNADNPYFYSSNIPNKAGGNWNILCPKYALSSAGVTASMQDKEIKGHATSRAVFIKDSAYTDAETFKASLAGVWLLHELDTPFTISASPYTELQICDPAGTEEYIDTRDVPIPVGHNTKYMRDLKKLLEGIPDAPTTNGTYVLKATVSSSGVTYSWVEG